MIVALKSGQEFLNTLYVFHFYLIILRSIQMANDFVENDPIGITGGYMM